MAICTHYSKWVSFLLVTWKDMVHFKLILIQLIVTQSRNVLRVIWRTHTADKLMLDDSLQSYNTFSIYQPFILFSFKSPCMTPTSSQRKSILFSFFQDNFLVYSLGWFPVRQVLFQMPYKNLPFKTIIWNLYYFISFKTFLYCNCKGVGWLLHQCKSVEFGCMFNSGSPSISGAVIKGQFVVGCFSILLNLLAGQVA